MPLSREQVYNDLNGAESKEILLQRFAARLNEIPWLQRNTTLPRVRMKLSVTFELYADQPTPESHTIADDFTIRTEESLSVVTSAKRLEPAAYDQPIEEIEALDTIDASPSTGEPPDKIRDDHGLPVATPRRNRATGVTADIMEHAELAPGITLDRGRSATPNPSTGATVVNQDFGPRLGRQGNEGLSVKNRDRSANPASVGHHDGSRRER